MLGLSLFALLRLRRDPNVRFWAIIAGATWVLSLGPSLQFLGRSRVPFLGVAIPLPYALLSHLPMLNIMRTPSRLTVFTMLALSILVACAFKSLLSRADVLGSPEAQRRINLRRNVIATGIPALIIFEFLAIPFPTVQPNWNVPIYAKIAGEAGRFALLELPLRPTGDYMAYQTIHDKPIIGGFLARQPPYPAEQQTPALKYLLDATNASDPLQASISEGKGTQALRDMGVKYVIVHWWLLTAGEKKAMETKLAALMGRPADFVYPANETAAWQLYP